MNALRCTYRLMHRSEASVCDLCGLPGGLTRINAYLWRRYDSFARGW